MGYNILDNFTNSLKNNPSLMPSSVNLYRKIIKELIDTYGVDPNVDQLNHFIAEKCRKRQPTAKYAIKYYLKNRWRPGVYEKLVQARVRAPSMKKKFVTKEEAKKILEQMRSVQDRCMNKKRIRISEEHTFIAKIQYLTGARASEVISLRTDKIEKISSKGRIELEVMGKGNKSRTLFLKDSYWEDLKYFVRIDDPYLFIRTHGKEVSEEVLWKKVESYYKRYYESLKDAAQECEVNIKTHDWRRSFAEALRKGGANIKEIKDALGHSKYETTERYFQYDTEEIAKTTLQHQVDI